MTGPRKNARVHIIAAGQPPNNKAETIQSADATNFLFKGYRLMGILMPKKHKLLYALYSLIPNVLVTIYLPFSFSQSFFKLAQEDLDVSNLLTSIQVAVNVLGCTAKIVIMAFLLPKLCSASNCMPLLDVRCKNEHELLELRKLVKQGNRCVVYFLMAYWTYSTSNMLFSILSGRPQYLLNIPFFDWHGTKGEFLAASFIEYALINGACFQQALNDSYPIIYILILRTHMNLLLIRIEKLARNPEWNLDQNLEELRLCIIDHENLLRLHKITSPIISVTVFIQFMITAIMLSVAMLNTLIFATKFSTQVTSVIYIVVVMVEIFPLCYYAQCLMNDSDRLAQTIFHSNWLEQDVRFRRMLIVFMQHTQRVMELSAGKIFPITLASFLSIAKYSFSLYTFLKRMNFKERFRLE